jgi:PPOX class probable F420-dependent enzyme
MATLTDDQARYFEETNFAVVGIVTPRGEPRTSIVWIDWDGENVVFNTTNARAKGRHLRTRPKASVTVWKHDDPYSYIEVVGTAVLDEQGAAEHINKLSHKYEGKDFSAPVDRVIVRVKPELVFDHT